MKSFGRYEIELSIDGKHPVKHSFFVLSELKGNAILGLDFISKFNVVIDGQDRSFTFSSDNDQHKIIAEIETKTEPVCKSKFDGLPFGLLSKKQENELLNLLRKFEKLFAASMVELGSCDVVQYKVNLSTDRPITIGPPFNRTPLSQQPILEKFVSIFKKENPSCYFKIYTIYD